jgi:dienelactone hydrolase
VVHNGYAHIVHDHYVAQVRDIAAERRRRLSGVRTRKQALDYQEGVRRAIHRIFRPRPRRTPLNPRITGAIERPSHRIEKILFESRPGCLVSANLYLPNRLNRPAPAVIGSCGHSEAGKAAPLYQGFCQRLSANGFVVLIYDPFSQGERDQYHGVRDRDKVGSCTSAHNMMGKQLELLGEWFGMWRAWDGIRALDYLLTRPEVDPARVGITGNSGGGTMTSWIWAIEPRLAMAAPGCFVTTFLANLENELPADSEQYPPGALAAGLELADFFIARAPQPAILAGQTFDFFDRRGLRQTYAEIQRFYDILGASRESLSLFIGPQGHGYSRHNQEAMVRFFARHASVRRVVRLEETEALDDGDLNATPEGGVVQSGGIPIHALISDAARRAASRRRACSGPELRRRLTRLLGLPSRRALPHYRVLRPDCANGTTIARYAVETEGPIRAILRRQIEAAERANTLDVEPELCLYLPHFSARTDMAADPLALDLAKGHPLYALDVRGIGESMPVDEHDFLHPYGMDYLHHGYGILLSQRYIGRRVHDLLATLDLLVENGVRRLHLAGRGQGSLLALFGGLLHPRVGFVTLKNAPLCCHGWTQTPVVAWPASNFVRGLLKVLDLPDCVRALGKKVRIIEPWGPDMEPLTGARLTRELRRAGLPRTLVKRGPRVKEGEI